MKLYMAVGYLVAALSTGSVLAEQWGSRFFFEASSGNFASVNSQPASVDFTFTAGASGAVRYLAQKISNVTGNPTWRVQIYQDNGSGGRGAALGTAYNGTPTATLIDIGTVNLTAGTVYHIFSETTFADGANNYRHYYGHNFEQYRTYDGVADPALQVYKNDAAQGRIPQFEFYDAGSNPAVPFAAGAGGYTSYSISNAATARGVSFLATFPSSSVRSIGMRIKAVSNPDANLLLALRDSTGTILGSSVVLAGSAPTSLDWLDVTLNPAVQVVEGQRYMVTASPTATLSTGSYQIYAPRFDTGYIPTVSNSFQGSDAYRVSAEGSWSADPGKDVSFRLEYSAAAHGTVISIR